MNNEKLAINLSERIKNYIELAERQERILCSFEWDFALQKLDPDEMNVEHYEAQIPFLFYMKTLRRDLISMATLMGLNGLVSELNAVSNESSDIFQIENEHLDHVMFSPQLRLFKQIFSSMTTMLKVNDASALAVFENILDNTAVIFDAKNIKASKETEVSGEVLKVLKYAFDDATRPSIPQLTKTFKPDLGVIKLKAAAEYKFVNSQEKLNVAIGGIYEDIHGYAGSMDWEIFYSVIYMTKPFITKKSLLKQFAKAKVPPNWDLFLLNG